jgi:hypothetical protein
MNASSENGMFESLRLELRRGCLIVAVLAQLRQEHYGYTLRKALADEGLAIEESTLYPLLIGDAGAFEERMARRRQEKQAILPAVARGRGDPGAAAGGVERD